MAQRFELMTGVDATHAPGTARTVFPSPGPGAPNSMFLDGDRLAGTSDMGPVVNPQGIGTPFYQPNQFGAMSFIFKRGSVPLAPPQRFPYMGIDFLGGPLLDLDGDLNNGTRSLIPVSDPEPVTPVEIPDSTSFIDLIVNHSAGTVTITGWDITGTSEGAPGVTSEVAVTLNTLAGTEPDGSQTGPINPGYDTRQGTVAPFAGTSGTLHGVFRIQDLRVEYWQDTLQYSSSTASTLGTFQVFAPLRGWLVRRDRITGDFPTLAGEGLGSTLWPLVDASEVGNVYNTAHGLAGGIATITNGNASDDFTAAGNGGVALADYGGDLGAYLDNAVATRVDAQSHAYIYLEAPGFGINNSGDPVFTDTISYDTVIVAQRRPMPFVAADLDGDGDVDVADYLMFQACFNGPDHPPAGPDCGGADFGNDDDVDVADFLLFQTCFNGPDNPPACAPPH